MFIKEDIFNPYIRIGYAKAIDMAKRVGKITVLSNPMTLSRNFILRQRLISAEIYSLGLINIDSFYNIRM